MKTTIVIDQEKLRRVSQLTGIKSIRKVIDHALTQAERLAEIDSVFSGDFYVSPEKNIVDKKYNLLATRRLDTPTK